MRKILTIILMVGVATFMFASTTKVVVEGKNPTEPSKVVFQYGVVKVSSSFGPHSNFGQEVILKFPSSSISGVRMFTVTSSGQSEDSFVKNSFGKINLGFPTNQSRDFFDKNYTMRYDKSINTYYIQTII